MFETPKITSPILQKEINATAFKYNLLIVKVGVVLNLIFALVFWVVAFLV